MRKQSGLAIENRKYDLGGFAVDGQQKIFLRVAYDKSVLPVLPLRHLLARLYLEEAHKIDHAGVDVMIMRSQSHVWIMRVRQENCDGLLCLQETGQEVHPRSPIVWASPEPQDGTKAVLLVNSGRSVRPPSHQRVCEQAFDHAAALAAV